MSAYLFVDYEPMAKLLSEADAVCTLTVDGVTTPIRSTSKVDVPDRGAVLATIATKRFGWTGYLPTRTTTPIKIDGDMHTVSFGGHVLPSMDGGGGGVSPWLWLVIAAMVIIAFMWHRS